MPMEIEIPTAGLVEAARSGDQAAFEVLVDRFRPLACRYAFALIQDAGLAEDACQDAFMDAYAHLDQLREPAAFAGWLRRIVIKQADRQRRRRLLFVELSEIPGARDPLAILVEAEASREIQEHLGRLPEHLRRVLHLFYDHGYAVREIAEFLEIPPGTIRKRLFDGRKRLRGALSVPPSNEKENRP